MYIKLDKEKGVYIVSRDTSILVTKDIYKTSSKVDVLIGASLNMDGSCEIK